MGFDIFDTLPHLMLGVWPSKIILLPVPGKQAVQLQQKIAQLQQQLGLVLSRQS